MFELSKQQHFDSQPGLSKLPLFLLSGLTPMKINNVTIKNYVYNFSDMVLYFEWYGNGLFEWYCIKYLFVGFQISITDIPFLPNPLRFKYLPCFGYLIYSDTQFSSIWIQISLTKQSKLFF